MPAPQLADRIAFDGLLKIVDNDDWSFEQKLDGERLMVACVDGDVVAFNRSGDAKPVPKPLLEWANELDWDGEWLFDGEYIDNSFWAFDMPLTPVDGYEEQSYANRRQVLDGIAETIVSDCFHVLPYQTDPIGKRKLMREVVDINAEGIMAKNLNEHSYRYGQRVGWMLKAKLWASAEAVVSEVSPTGKASVELVMFHQGTPRGVGSCKVTDRVLASIQIGDVIEVKYLYATKTHKLYQPSLLRVRTDKPAIECTLDQLKPANKQILS